MVQQLNASNVNKVYLAPENPKYPRMSITPDLKLSAKSFQK